MKKIILAILLIVSSINLYSQTDELNHEKYWYYRYRMQHYFTDVGSGIYKSLVAARRNTNKFDDLFFGDQTYDMGWYISVLAIEYNMISVTDNDDEINQTLTELYYLLSAFNRLDYCESKLDYLDHNTSRIDGFFVRKDPEMFDESYPYESTLVNMNDGLTHDDNFGSRPPGHPTFVDILDDGDSEIRRYEMSQDHVIYLLMGMATLKRAFEYNRITSFYNVKTKTIIEFDFYNHGINVSNRLLNYIHNTPPEHGLFPWKIYNPDGVAVPRGNECKGYSYGFAAAAEWLTGSIGLYDSYAISIGKPAWHIIGYEENPTLHNNIMELALGTIGDSWVLPRNPMFPFINIEPTDYYIKDKSEDNNHDFFFIMLYEYLHEKESPYERTVTINDIINHAPFCGPYRYSEIDCFEYEGVIIPPYPEGNMGWAHHNRYRRTISEANGNHSERGNFPGLDYMITYNLYRILNGGTAYRNMINTKLNQDYPFEQGGEWYGTESNPANLRAFETFECNNEVQANATEDASLNLIASNSIKLMPGFHVYQGAHFTAKVEEYDCWAAGGNGSNKSSYFHDNGYVYNYNVEPMATVNENDEQYQANLTEYKNTHLLQKENQAQLNIYPNPAKNQINIEILTPAFEPIQLIIRDIYGNTAISKANFTGGIIDISTLTKGVYLIEASINGIVYQKRLVVL